jgi:beta-lactamase regulating signal transducer with metallopeptidase domain
MSSAFSLDPSTSERLTWTLVHFLWQGLALAALLWASLAVMRTRGTRPRFRYLACCACLVCMAIAPVLTYLCVDRSVFDPGPLRLAQPLQGTAPATPVAGTAPPTIVQRTSFWLRANVQQYAAPLATTWAAAVCVLGIFQLFRLTLLQRSVRTTSSELPPAWESLRSIPAKVGVRYPVSIVVSTLVDAPATLGWLKPIVLLPASILSGLPVEVVEALVAHELAHVRQWDYLVNLLQAALETLLWWHPAVWWVSGRVRDEREHCCDELAAGVSGGRVKYAKALTALEDLRVRPPQFAMGAKGGSLVARVTRLVGAPAVMRHRRNRGGVAAVFAAVGLATLMAARLSSSAASTPPTRGIEQVQSLCGAVYEILGVNPPAGATDRDLWLERLDAVVAQEEGPERRPAEDQLVDAMLRQSAPDQLAPEILARVQLGAHNAYESAPDWTHGTYLQRINLQRLLWLRAKELRGQGKSDRAAAYARAAVLLSAQEGVLLGIAPMYYLSNDSEFESLARLDARQAIQLRRHLEDHNAIAVSFGQYRLHADRALAELRTTTTTTTTMPATATDPAVVAAAERRVIESIDEMIALSEGRPDLQWQAASAAARLFARRSSPSGLPSLAWAQTWGARLPHDPHFARWMKEAAERPSRVKDPRRVSPAQLRKSARRVNGPVPQPR